MFYVYIIYSPSHNKYYKGYTSHLQQRLLQHNSGSYRFTAAFIPWELVYFETFTSVTQALKSERSLKKYDHSQIKELIRSFK